MDCHVSERDHWACAVAVVSLLSLVLVGCSKSDPMGTVQGKVLLNDAPFSDAAVGFMSLETGRGGMAPIAADGTFEMVTPIPVGTYKVYLEPKIDEADVEQPKPVYMDNTVPAKYWNEASTDISIDVVEGENQVTVTLQK